MMLVKRCVLLAVLTVLVSSLSLSQMARQWVARYGGTLKNGANAATAMAVDDSGNVYVTGWITRSGSGVDFATVKYSPDGELRWQQF